MNLTELKECVELLEVMAGQTSRKKRMEEVERLTDEYVGSTGRTPSEELLTRMANVILHEELTDSHPDKMSRKITPEMSEDERRRHEYPILSDRMYVARVSGDQRKKRKDGTTITEVPLSHAMNRGMDGKDYTLPSRKTK